MKRTDRMKYLIAYGIITVFMFLALNTLGRTSIYQRLAVQEKDILYEEAALITKDYVPDTSVLTNTGSTLRKHFRSLQNLTGMRVWLVSATGTVIMDSQDEGSLQGKNINRYDAAFLSNQSITGKYPKGMLEEEVISVIYPITASLDTDGYVVLMRNTAELREKAASYTDAVLVCYVVMFVVIGVVLGLLWAGTSMPLRKITRVTREYADGHFQKNMPEKLSVEQRELSDAIDYLADRVETQNEYQKKFIANVSHDFRSPLTSIKGYTQALADGTIPQQMQEKYFNIILFEVERLTKLTGNLLTLNQLDYGGMTLEQSVFDINDAIKKTSASFEQRCMKKKVSLHLIFEKPECFVYADINKIEQVIQNLLDNAIKFSSNDSNIEIHTTQERQKVFVSVKDYGIGIPKESISRVWSRFYKTDLSRGKDKTGTGLGLSITKEIIEAHGENINVISTEGAGTEFIFSLPAKKGE